MLLAAVGSAASLVAEEAAKTHAAVTSPHRPVQQEPLAIPPVRVSDPTKAFLTPLPSGATDLTRYRATEAVLAEYFQSTKFRGEQRDRRVDRGLVTDEWKALRFYKGPGYKKINPALREIEQRPIDRKMELQILATASAVNGAPQYSGEAARGVFRLPESVVAAYCEGCYVAERQFTSTSAGSAPSGIWNEAPVQFHYRKAKGADVTVTPGLYDAEDEILLPPGAVFKVISNRREGATTRIELEQVTPAPEL
jgi:hypothetical protein